jgi:3-isopropylmalate dehydratase small subunit
MDANEYREFAHLLYQSSKNGYNQEGWNSTRKKPKSRTSKMVLTSLAFTSGSSKDAAPHCLRKRRFLIY